MGWGPIQLVLTAEGPDVLIGWHGGVCVSSVFWGVLTLFYCGISEGVATVPMGFQDTRYMTAS